MTKYFTTGLAIFLPIFVTFVIVTFIVNTITGPFLEIVKSGLIYLGFDSSSILITVISKLFILLTTILIIIAIGFLGTLFVTDYVLKFADRLIHSIPFVNKIYIACSQVVYNLFSADSKSFSKVALVPYPSTQALCIGFITKEAVQLVGQKDNSDFIPVFVPTTPNPTVGYMLMFKENEIVFLNMKVDEAIKFIISCGVVSADFFSKEEVKHS